MAPPWSGGGRIGGVPEGPEIRRAADRIQYLLNPKSTLDGSDIESQIFDEDTHLPQF